MGIRTRMAVTSDEGPLRIVHGASNIAGLPVAFARAQRRLGHRSTAILYPAARGAGGYVELTRLVRGNRATRQMRRARLLAWLVAHYDIFHFHFHTTFLPMHRDLAVLRAAGKRIIFHLHGCDIRDPRRIRGRDPVSACAECPIQCMVPIKLHLPDAIRRYADAAIVSTPDLLEFVPDAIYLPNPLDTTPWRWIGAAPRAGGPFVIAHAPTDRAIKGTHYVEEAVAQLQAEGLDVELRLLAGVSQEEMRRACAEADVVVDQVLIGWIGLFALEMMALGKPVVAYVRPDLAARYPCLPVANSSPAELADTLRRLLRDRDERDMLSARGMAYVREHHDPDAINARVIGIYRALRDPAR